MKTLKELEDELDVTYGKHSKRLNDAPPNMGFDEFESYMSVTGDVLNELDSQMRMIQPPEYSELPDYGEVMSLDEFISNCNDGGFIDYDGSGNYVKDGKKSNITIYHSDVKNGNIRNDFDSVIWFNR